MDRTKYCSKDCYNKGKLGSKQSPETVKKRARILKGMKRSLQFRERISSLMRGKGNHRYTNGWTLDREERRLYKEKQRYGYTKDEIVRAKKARCENCGVELGRRLHVHHIDGNGRNSKNPNNALSNLRLLCSKCHGKTHLTSERAKAMNELSRKVK
jgi:5-methylcytosine-specific restriction endonuclease McrA